MKIVGILTEVGVVLRADITTLWTGTTASDKNIPILPCAEPR